MNLLKVFVGYQDYGMMFAVEVGILGVGFCLGRYRRGGWGLMLWSEWGRLNSYRVWKSAEAR